VVLLELATAEQFRVQVRVVEFQTKLLAAQVQVAGPEAVPPLVTAVQFTQQRLSVLFQYVPAVQTQLVGVGLVAVASAKVTRLQLISHANVAAFQKYLVWQKHVAIGGSSTTFKSANLTTEQFIVHNLTDVFHVLGVLHMHLSVALLVAIKSAAKIFEQLIIH